MRPSRTHRHPHGFAMALFLVILMVITVSTTALVVTASQDISSSAKTVSYVSGKSLASSGVEEFYSRFSFDKAFSDSVTTGASTGHPAVGAGNWASLKDGRAVACTGYAEDCYHVDVVLSDNLDSKGKASALLVDVTARTDCVVNADSKPDCTLTRFQQRLRKLQATDYLFFSQRTALAPEAYLAPPDYSTICDKAAPRPAQCLEAAYLGQGTAARDVINGPLYTADTYILTCGDPMFKSTVSVAGVGMYGKVNLKADDPLNGRGDTCYSGTPTFDKGDTGVNAPVVELPTELVTQADAEAVTPSQLKLTAVSGMAVLQVSNASGASPQVLITGTDQDGLQPLDQAKNSIVVYGDVTISGDVVGSLSVYVTGKIYIDADLTYHSGPTTANPTDLTVLVANGGVIILPPGAPEDREVDALLLSLQQGVYVQGWDTDPGSWVGQTPPTLHLFGAMASKFQGVFGGYDAATGELVNGFRKDFTFDSRLSNNSSFTPAFTVSGTSDAWTRVDMSEVAPCPLTSADATIQAICSIPAA